MENKIVDNHTYKCCICKEMARRGYKEEWDYFDDFMGGKLKPVAYKLIKKNDKTRPIKKD